MRYEGPSPAGSLTREDHWAKMRVCSYTNNILEAAHRWLAWSVEALVAAGVSDEDREQFSREAQWEAEFIEAHEHADT